MKIDIEIVSVIVGISLLFGMGIGQYWGHNQGIQMGVDYGIARYRQELTARCNDHIKFQIKGQPGWRQCMKVK
jgi:hypothetical protein